MRKFSADRIGLMARRFLGAAFGRNQMVNADCAVVNAHYQFRNLTVIRYFITPLNLPLLRGDLQVSPLGKGGRKGGKKIDHLCSRMDRHQKILPKKQSFVLVQCRLDRFSLIRHG